MAKIIGEGTHEEANEPNRTKSPLSYADLQAAVSNLQNTLGERDDLKAWEWSTAGVSGPPNTRSIRLPPGYTLEQILGCTQEQLEAIGLRNTFVAEKSNTTFYHFNIRP